MSRRAKIISLPFLLAALSGLCVVLARMLDVGVAPVLLLALGAIVAGVVLLYVRMIVAIRRLVLVNQQGVALLNQGRGEEALREFERCVKEAKAARLESYGRLFQANVACAYVELGRHREAHAIVQSLLTEDELKRSLAASWGHFVGLVATILWLSPDAADDEPAQFLATHEPHVPPAQQALLTTAHVLVLLREGRDTEADALLAKRWREAEGLLPARRLRRLTMLWAFALHRAGRADDARRKLETAGEDVALENRMLVAHWPELAAYLSSAQGYRDAAR